MERENIYSPCCIETLPIKSGEISLKGINVTGIEAHKLVYQGMAHVPEG